MRGKKLFAAALSLLVAGAVLVTGCGGSAKTTGEKKEGAKYTFRLAETHPPDYPTTLGDKKFAELVYERTNGRIKIEVFPSGQLGEEKAVIEQVQLGAIEFTRVSASPLAEFNKQLGVLSLPYIFDSDEHMWKFLSSDMGNKMLDGLETSKMKGLAYYSSGSRSFYARKPIKSLDDLKGLKIRVQQSKINMDMISALGASATPMPYGEVFSALQTGVIDGAENNYPSYYSSNHYQVAKYYLLDRHQRVPEVLLVSKATWDKLSDEDKKIIKQAALDSVKTQRELWDKFEKEAEAKLRAAGVTITEVTDVKPWQAAVKPVIDKYGPEYKEVLEAIDKARK
ncbi:TRAP transporter substrate-binding protein [Sporolituus thermophilus]|uniref:Tripartite ATP-independent transporter solute receptor, DctP family n=1 Tax=Sporolituus thermophilus DSM 23256 TaxID=1123285 RepID=A0A1G7PAS3_9FIRM|nr:TRAP transporter substrate-binding protein [Sporolituus thermophilus]SDF82699.1 tripartite ATP-independent transporter solute receptor, DctP family [Sporolituus thermophilus DSM 23256]